MRLRLSLLSGVGIVAAVALIGAGVVFAVRSPQVMITLHDVPARGVYAGEDVLGIDMSIAAPGGDVLDVLTVRQDGAAQWQIDLASATLWSDAGADGFQGRGRDVPLADGEWDATLSGWVFRAINANVPSGGARFFVTTRIAASPSQQTTVRLQIPAFTDTGLPMEYNGGDRGIFLRTARVVPAAPLVGTTHTVVQGKEDVTAPIARITDPIGGATTPNDWLHVRGIAYDIGGSAPAKVSLSINRVGHEVTWVDAIPEVTGFATWEARLFGLPRGETLELRVRSEDWVGNRSGLSAPTVVTLLP
jgi:hypothetical protein